MRTHGGSHLYLMSGKEPEKVLIGRKTQPHHFSLSLH